MKECYIYIVKVTRVIDGDTIVGDIDLGFNVVLKDEHIRLMNVDTPEIRTRDEQEKERGLKAKKFVEDFCKASGDILMLRCLSFNDRGKYGRIIGELYSIKEHSDVSLNQLLIEKNLVK